MLRAVRRPLCLLLVALGVAGCGGRGGGAGPPRPAAAGGTPGGVATEELVARTLRAAGWSVRFQRVTFPFFDERRPPAVTLPGGRRLAPEREVRTLAYSAGGEAR